MNRKEMEDRVIGKLADLFATIGNPIRLKILYALREQGSGMKWQNIQELTGASGGTLKFHMDKLESFNLAENFHGEYRITEKGIGLLYLVDMLKDKVEMMLQIEMEQYDFQAFFPP